MFTLPKTALHAECHPDTAEISKELEGYFLVEWPFPSDKYRTKFLDAKLGLISCLVLPNGPKYRVKLAGELSILFTLIDDLLEKISYAAGAALIERLISIGRGSLLPNSASPVEMLHNAFFQRLRKEDPVLGLEICERYYDLMRVQSSPERSQHSSLKEYLDFREIESGSKMFISASYFVQGINPNATQRAALASIERTASNHFVLLNDIVSWDRELGESLSGSEGSQFCSSVAVAAEQFGVDYDSARTVLAAALRETERVFLRQRDELLARCAGSEEPDMNDDVKTLLEELELRVAGVEQWHFETARYQV